MRPLEPSKNKALVTVAGSLQEKHARGAYGEAVPKTTTNHRYVKSIVDTKVAFGDTLAKPSNSNLTAAHSSKLLGALPLGKGSADTVIYAAFFLITTGCAVRSFLADLLLRLRLCGGQRLADLRDAAVRRPNADLRGPGARGRGGRQVLQRTSDAEKFTSPRS